MAAAPVEVGQLGLGSAFPGEAVAAVLGSWSTKPYQGQLPALTAGARAELPTELPQDQSVLGRSWSCLAQEA